MTKKFLSSKNIMLYVVFFIGYIFVSYFSTELIGKAINILPDLYVGVWGFVAILAFNDNKKKITWLSAIFTSAYLVFFNELFWRYLAATTKYSLASAHMKHRALFWPSTPNILNCQERNWGWVVLFSVIITIVAYFLFNHHDNPKNEKQSRHDFFYMNKYLAVICSLSLFSFIMGDIFPHSILSVYFPYMVRKAIAIAMIVYWLSFWFYATIRAYLASGFKAAALYFWWCFLFFVLQTTIFLSLVQGVHFIGEYYY